MKEIAKEKGEKKTYAKKGEPKIFRTMGVEDANTKLGYIYYENNSKSSTLKEEISLIDIEGLEVIGYSYTPRSMKVVVPPGESKIILLNQIRKAYVFKVEYYTSIVRSESDLKRQVKIRGEKKQISFDSKLQDIYYYVYDDGDGYLWMFENESEDIIFNGTFHFNLRNLIIPENKHKIIDDYEVHLNPGEKSYMRMNIVDISKPWGYKCKLSFNIEDDLSNEKKLIEKIYAEGELQKCLVDNRPINIEYRVLFINDMYVWLFENNTNRKFTASFKFYLENLKSDDDVDGMPRTTWEIFLNPGERCLKKMHQINPLRSSSYECTYSCDLL